jgi:hypothetical protein
MAENLILVAKLRAEVDEAVRDVTKAKAAYTSLTKTLDQLKKQGKENTDEFRKASAELLRLEKSIGKTESAFTKLKSVAKSALGAIATENKQKLGNIIKDFLAFTAVVQGATAALNAANEAAFKRETRAAIQARIRLGLDIINQGQEGSTLAGTRQGATSEQVSQAQANARAAIAARTAAIQQTQGQKFLRPDATEAEIIQAGMRGDFSSIANLSFKNKAEKFGEDIVSNFKSAIKEGQLLGDQEAIALANLSQSFTNAADALGKLEEVRGLFIDTTEEGIAQREKELELMQGTLYYDLQMIDVEKAKANLLTDEIQKKQALVNLEYRKNALTRELLSRGEKLSLTPLQAEIEGIRQTYAGQMMSTEQRQAISGEYKTITDRLEKGNFAAEEGLRLIKRKEAIDEIYAYEEQVNEKILEKTTALILEKRVQAIQGILGVTGVTQGIGNAFNVIGQGVFGTGMDNEETRRLKEIEFQKQITEMQRNRDISAEERSLRINAIERERMAYLESQSREIGNILERAGLSFLDAIQQAVTALAAKAVVSGLVGLIGAATGTGSFGSIFSSVFGSAGGNYLNAGTSSKVNELGIEAFRTNKGMTIIPNERGEVVTNADFRSILSDMAMQEKQMNVSQSSMKVLSANSEDLNGTLQKLNASIQNIEARVFLSSKEITRETNRTNAKNNFLQ